MELLNAPILCFTIEMKIKENFKIFTVIAFSLALVSFFKGSTSSPNNFKLALLKVIGNNKEAVAFIGAKGVKAQNVSLQKRLISKDGKMFPAYVSVDRKLTDKEKAILLKYYLEGLKKKKVGR